MKCKGRFVFRELKKIEKGVFTNDKGEEIPYNESYKLKVDEISEDGINERVFKVATDNVNVLNGLKNVEPYNKIDIEFDLGLYPSGARLTPSAVFPVK